MIPAVKTVAFSLIILLLSVSTCLAGPIIIKLSHVVGPDTPKGKASEYFKRLVEQRSNGRVRVEVYPNGVLFDDWDAQAALKDNEIQMAAPSYSKLSKLNPQLQLFGLPFLFKNVEHLHDVIDGDIGAELLQNTSRDGLTALTFWDNGFKQFTANRELIVPEDAAGLRFRIEGSKVLEAQFRSVGATSVTIPFPLLYNALKNNEIDAQENTLSNIYNHGLYRLQSDLTISNHGYLGYLVLTSSHFWSSLPEDLKVIVRGALDDATDYIREMAIKLNEDALENIRSTGTMRIHELTSSEKDTWRARMKSIYAELHSDINKELIQRVEAKLVR